MLERRIARRCSCLGSLALVALLAPFAAAPAAAQQQTGNLFVGVVDDQGQALPGVTVTLTGIGAPQVQVTDPQGECRFLNLSPGRYALRAELEGFSPVEYPDVNISVGRNTELEVTLSPAVSEAITVTAEAPLLDARQTSRVTALAANDLESLPTARDPWSLLSQTPGVQVDRVNVGGNESGQQSGFLGPGAAGSENVFAVDGVVLTDMAAVGASATYFDFGAFEEVQLTVSSADVTVATAGVTVNQVTKRGTNEWKGEGRYLRTDGELQSEPSVAFGNKIESVEEYGANVGGPILRDRLWIWGSWGESDIRNLAPSPSGDGRLSDRTVIKDYNAKLNAQLGPSNSGVFHFWTNDKLKFGRVFTFLGAPLAEATHDQTTPSDIWKVEDTHQFGSRFLLTGLWSKDNGDFTLAPKGGRDAAMFTDADNVLHGTSFDFSQHAVIEQARLDGNYFATTGEANHELKFGAGFREQENQSTTVWPRGHNVFYYDGTIAILRASRNRVLSAKTEYQSAWLQDTVTLDRWTFAAGARYDKQSGENLASVSPENPLGGGFIPELRFNGNDAGGFEWETIVPRLSATVALGAERSTLLRATFSQYAQQLGHNRISFVNPAGGYSYAYFYFEDRNGNLQLEPGEVPSISFGYTYNINEADPGSQLSANVNDPGLEPAMTDEITLGLEHMFRPELAGSITATWRQTKDVVEFWSLITDESGLVRPWTRADFELRDAEPEDADGNPDPDVDPVRGTLPDGTIRAVPLYGLRDGLSATGGSLVTNGDSDHEYLGFTAAFVKRLSNRWSARGHVTWNDWDWNIGPQSLLHDDPTNTTGDGITADGDGDIYTEGSGGSKADVFLGSRWSFGLNGLYQVAPERPWGFNIVASLTGREGYGSPPEFRASRGEPGRVLVELTDSVGEVRNDDVILLDARVEKELEVGDFSWLLGIDGFNLLNEDYVLQRDRRTDLGSAHVVRERLSPRVFRVGVTLRFR